MRPADFRDPHGPHDPHGPLDGPRPARSGRPAARAVAASKDEGAGLECFATGSALGLGLWILALAPFFL